MVNEGKSHRDISGRRPGLRMLGATIPKLTGKALRKRGFVESALIYRWSSLVGVEVASWCAPDRVTFPRDERVGATLHLLVPGARALELQHLEPLLLERINTVFGYNALERISIRRGALPETAQKTSPTSRQLESEQQDWIVKQVSEFQDQNLKNAMRGLGRAVLSRK